MIAAALEVSTPTIGNWKKLPHFKSALAEAINFKAESSNYKPTSFQESIRRMGFAPGSQSSHPPRCCRLACESYSAIAKAAAEEKMLSEMEQRMEQLAANFQAGTNIIESAQDAEFKELPHLGIVCNSHSNPLRCCPKVNGSNESADHRLPQ